MSVCIHRKRVLHYFLIYCLIISQGSILYKNYQDWFYIATYVLFFVFYVIKTGGKLKDKTYFWGIGAILVSLLVSYTLTGGSLGIPSILNIISRFLFIYIIYDYDRGRFCERYIKLVAALAAISLVLFFVQIIDPEIITAVFPQYVNSNQTYYGTMIYTMALTHVRRNVGVFAEPGLYQIVLCSAIFIILFMDEKLKLPYKAKRGYLILLFLTLITAQSTTGYVSGIILMAIFFLSKQRAGYQKIKLWLVICVLLFLIWDLGKGTDGVLYSTIYVKMFDVRTGAFNLNQNTGRARILSGIADLRIARKYPLGAGFRIYESIWKSYLPGMIYDSSSCMGITKSMATFGIPTTVFILLFYYHLMRKNRYSMPMKLAYSLLFFNISLGQPSITYPALMILLLINPRLDSVAVERKALI